MSGPSRPHARTLLFLQRCPFSALFTFRRSVFDRSFSTFPLRRSAHVPHVVFRTSLFLFPALLTAFRVGTRAVREDQGQGHRGGEDDDGQEAGEKHGPLEAHDSCDSLSIPSSETMLRSTVQFRNEHVLSMIFFFVANNSVLELQFFLPSLDRAKFISLLHSRPAEADLISDLFHSISRNP